MSDALASLDAATLAVRAQAGDRAAEGALCVRLAPAVRSFARRRLRSRDAVHDFEQEVLLLFVEALRRGSLEEPARVGGFVLGICRNLAHDRVKSRERRAALWEQFGSALAPLEAETSDQPSTGILRLEDCLTELSQRARELIWLSYGELRSHAEIAAQLGISEANARVLRHRSLHVLRACIEVPKRWEVQP